MSARTVARSVAFGRIAIGAAMIVAPRRIAVPWVGAAGDTDGAAVLTRAFGGREVLLGFLAAHVVDQPGVGARTTRSMALLDALDAGATLAARRALPAPGVALVTAMAAGSAAVQVWAAGRLQGVVSRPARWDG
jgi:hypothetical protein